MSRNDSVSNFNYNSNFNYAKNTQVRSGVLAQNPRYTNSYKILPSLSQGNSLENRTANMNNRAMKSEEKLKMLRKQLKEIYNSKKEPINLNRQSSSVNKRCVTQKY